MNKKIFSEIKVFQPEVYTDYRGELWTTWKKENFDLDFNHDKVSTSRKNVIRGIHMQLVKPQGKLITVLSGKIFDVSVDCRPRSKTFGKYFSIELSEKNNTSLYIPEGFAHGFCSLSENTILHYKCTNYRNKNSEVGILWNDKELKIKWPKKKYIISARDRKNLPFKRFISEKIIEK